ncbi:MAG: outer membrane beta-barrel protein [Bacteroidota bacterium]
MRALACAITLCSFFVASSQVKFYFQAGMTVSTFDTDLMDDYGFIDYRQGLIDGGVNASSEARNSIRPGAMVGLEMDVYVNENTFLKTGVKYTNGGDSFFFKTSDIQYGNIIRSDARFKLRPRLDYISIPLNYGKQIKDFTIYGGVTTAINVASALRVNSFDVSNPNNVQEDWDREDDLVIGNKTVFFLNAGLNYFIPAFDIDQVVSLNIGYSLNSVYDDPNVVGDFNNAGMWLIEIGYGITLSL